MHWKCKRCVSEGALERTVIRKLFVVAPVWGQLVICKRERERELRKEGREVASRVRLREGPIGVRITLGQPTISVTCNLLLTGPGDAAEKPWLHGPLSL